MGQFVLGMLVIASIVAGLFFLRFWRQTRDRLFLIFAAAFFLLGVNWLWLSFVQTDEVDSAAYAVRLLAFVLILIAIVDKNRVRSR